MTLANRLYAGDTLDFPVDVPDYPPADGWTFKLRLVPRFATPVQAPITLTAVVDGTGYRVQATPAVTALWAAGAYGWHSSVEKVGARQTLEGTQYSGETTVLPDPSTLAQGADTRSAARKALDDAVAAQRAYVASNATVAEYTIGERRMKFREMADFDLLIGRLKIEVSREMRNSAIASGQPDPRKIYVRAIRG